MVHLQFPHFITPGLKETAEAPRLTKRLDALPNTNIYYNKSASKIEITRSIRIMLCQNSSEQKQLWKLCMAKMEYKVF
jgi:hypothetical protein